MRLVDRIELRFTTATEVDGLWVGVSLSSEPEVILRRVEDALRLIKVHDPRRYNRLLSDLHRIWVRRLPGLLGNFNQAMQACELDRHFVTETSRPELIAAIIVHEATHARLHRCGIGYEEALRPRVEAACIHRELAFAAKLPNGSLVRENAERALEACIDADWTDAHLAERRQKDGIESLRNLGVPDWLLRTLIAIRRR